MNTDQLMDWILWGDEGENGYFERKKQEFLREHRPDLFNEPIEL